MAIPLFDPTTAGLTAGQTGPWVDVWPCAGKFVEMRVVAVGGFTVDKVTIQHAIGGQESDPISLAPTIADHEDLIIDEPVERIRAIAGGALVGAAKVYVVPSL